MFQTHCYKFHLKETKSGRRYLSVKEKVKLLVPVKQSPLLTISVFHYFTSNMSAECSVLMADCLNQFSIIVSKMFMKSLNYFMSITGD